MYRLYLDEVGCDDLKRLETDSQKYLSLSGVIANLHHVDVKLIPNMDWIKREVFKHDPDDPIIFHRKEIMGFKGPFQALRCPETATLWNKAVLRLFVGHEYRVITTLIDKPWMLRQRTWNNNHPYHWLMEVIVEKYTQYLERVDEIGDIMPESRGGRKDAKLQEAYKHVRNTGTYYVSASRIQSRLRSPNLKFRTKKDNIAGLQLCDLLAHPSHIYVRKLMGHEVTLGPFAVNIVEILKADKYDRSNTGRIDGYGIKRFP